MTRQEAKTLTTTLDGPPRSRTLPAVGRFSVVLALIGLVLGVLASSALATSLTWSGGAVGEPNWSSAANWLGGIAPTTGEAIETLTLPKLASFTGGTDNVSGLTINHIQADDSKGYGISGDGITLGSGGLTIASSEAPTTRPAFELNNPLTLSASQTWEVSGPNPAELTSPPNVDIYSVLTGESANLTINLHRETWFFFENIFSRTNNNDELGNITVTGEEAVKGAERHRSLVELPTRINATDGHRLTLRGVQASSAIGGTATGPLTAEDSSVGLTGSEIGPVTSIASGIGIEGKVASVSLDSASSLGFTIEPPHGIGGIGHSEFTSTGTISLGGSELGIGSLENEEGLCPKPTVGEEYTLISTTGAITGSFSNAPEGATVTAECIAASGGVPRIERVYPYRINFHLTGSPRTMVATALAAVPILYEEGAPTITGTPTQGQILTESHGNWGNAPASYAYQWERCNTSGASCSNISGATGQSYTLTAADVGATIRVSETATNSEGAGTPALSAQTAVIAAGAESKTEEPKAKVEAKKEEAKKEEPKATISNAQVTAALVTGLGSAAKASIAKLLKQGQYAMTFQALEAGTLVVQWYEVPVGAKLAKTKPKPILVASGQLVFTAAGRGTVHVRLTSAGKRLLKHTSRVKLTAKGTFTPIGKAGIATMKTFSIFRRK